MNDYEMTVVYNGTLEDDQIMPLVDRTTELITRFGGEIGKTDHWGRRRLAYAINKKNTGYYVQFVFKAPGDIVHQLERFFHIDENVMRHLILQMSDLDLKKREEMKARLIAAAEAEEAANDSDDRDEEDD